MTRMPRGPRGERRPADVIGTAVFCCDLRRYQEAALFKLRHYPILT
jgi:hypothetical protein